MNHTASASLCGTPMFVLNAWAPLDDNEVVHDVFKNFWNVIDNNPEAPQGSYKYGYDTLYNQAGSAAGWQLPNSNSCLGMPDGL